MFRRAALTVLLGLTVVGFGQIDPAAEPFLENVAVEARVPVRALDYTICYTQTDEVDVCVRTALDFAKRRMLTQIRHSHKTVVEHLYTGEQVMTRSGGLEPTVLPADQAAVFKRIFAYSDDIVRTGGSLPEKVFRATYDGVKNYGEVVRGGQVTAEVMASSFTLSRVAPRRTTLRLVFRSDKKLLALVSDVPPEHLMLVLADPAEPVLMRRMLSGSVYWLRGGKPVLAHTQRLTRYRLNPKLADALFTFGNGAAAAATSSGKAAPAKTPR